MVEQTNRQADRTIVIYAALCAVKITKQLHLKTTMSKIMLQLILCNNKKILGLQASNKTKFNTTSHFVQLQIVASRINNIDSILVVNLIMEKTVSYKLPLEKKVHQIFRVGGGILRQTVLVTYPSLIFTEICQHEFHSFIHLSVMGGSVAQW